MQADPSISESTGHGFQPNRSLHGWTFEVEATTGFTVAVGCTSMLQCDISSTVLARSHKHALWAYMAVFACCRCRQ